MFVAYVLALIGVVAFAVGVALVATGTPVLWLAWAGAAIALVALATRYLLAQTLRSATDHIAHDSLTTIYMPLLNEGTDVWRAVEAIKIGDLGYMVTENPPADEDWAFQLGHILKCEERQFSGKAQLVAVAKAA